MTQHLVEALRRIVKFILFFGLCLGNRRLYFRYRSFTVRLLALFGLYERRNIALLKKVIRSGDTVIDVGASFGVYTRALSKLVGENGKVVAFEPLVDVFQLLEQTTARCSNVTCVNAGLSDKSQNCHFRIPLLFKKIPEPALATVEEYSGEIEWSEGTLTTLDEFWKSTGLRSVSFIKVDIEGHESAFLRGAKHTIASSRPVIQFEENDFDRNTARYQEFLKTERYEVYYLNGERLCRVGSGKSLAGQNNFYLFPSERTPD